MDPNGEDFTITAVEDPPNGSVVLSNGNIIYTPDPDFCGEDVFDYTIGNVYDQLISTTVTITVVCVNDGPTPPN